LFLQVEGTAKQRKKSNASDQVKNPMEQVSETLEPSSSIWDGITSFFSSSSAQPSSAQQQSSTSLLQCPCEIVANVTGGGLFVGGNKLFNLDFIKGTGVVRVLYADTNLRILESPYQNNGGWEDQGLIAVQVREELLSKKQ
jgi:hypothetical protein